MKSKKQGKLPQRILRQEIRKLLQANPKVRFNAKQVIRLLGLGNSKDSVHAALEYLSEDAVLVAMPNYKFKWNNKQQHSSRLTIEGRVDMTRNGAAFILTNELDDDIFVSASKLNFALDGDLVSVRYRYQKRSSRRPEGEVVEILNRKTDLFIGTISVLKKYAFVVPDKVNMPVDIMVQLPNIGEAKDGDKVIVKIIKWHDENNRSPKGEVQNVLGAAGSHEVEMQSILVDQGFELEFSPDAAAQAEALEAGITPEEIAKRRDMRKVPTITIDPVDAKDFDDAISFQHLDDGSFEIGVHIADVAHYVQEGTPLDKDAYRRSTSVYLVDRTLPMLPERLSNGICSLRPNEEKLVFSAVFTFNNNKQITNRWFGRSVIESDRRFTYEEAQERIESGEGDFAKDLQQLNRVAHMLRKRRFKNGSVSLESKEVKFTLDENNKPTSVILKKRKDAHMLVEDFMLLANREVATFIDKKGKDEQKPIPFVYRIHDLPDTDRVVDLSLFARELGFSIDPGSPQSIRNSFNKLSDAAQERPELELLLPLAIRTMAKAVYTTDNIGHYGLGFQNYSHFTSPIRRYADVLTHRLLDKNLEKSYRTDKAKLEQQCNHISDMERSAKKAERESVKFKQSEYLNDHVGSEFEGMITGFSDHGMYVQLIEVFAEGMVAFRDLDEPFREKAGGYRVEGVRSKQVYSVGDTIMVSIKDVDLQRRRIDLDLVD